MIPASPAVMAPPVKKQRAGNTPEDPIGARTQNAINDRSERLQDLAHRYGTVPRGQYPPSMQNGYGPSNGLLPALPQSRPGETIRGGARFPPKGMNDNIIDLTRGRGPPPGPRLTAGGRPSLEMQQTANTLQKSAPPPKPGMAMMQPRRSDIFPSVSKQSPFSSKPSNSFVTAAAIKSPQMPLLVSDGAVARRLDESFQANSDSTPTSQMRSKSAPPTRPPPPPGPPPLTKEDPARNVTFQIPQSSTMISPPNRIPLSGKAPESTATPDDTAVSTRDAGATPFYNAGPPGATPYHSNHTDELPTPPTTARRDLLRNMREYAESPDKTLTSPTGSVGSVKSPELRLHEQLASTEKDRAAALRTIAQLQDEIGLLKQKQESNNHSNHSRSVGFMSPVANVATSPSPSEKRNRRSGTPHPKSSLPKPSTPNEIDEERRCLLEATTKAPFEYDSIDGITFMVRRPYGLASETDLWYKVGQLPAKLYAKSSNVEFLSTLEVAATISCDNSIFLLFGDNEVRHQSNVTGISTDYDNVEERSSALGKVMYVDKNAIDKEYSLDELYEIALSIRWHYSTTVKSFATALQLHPPEPYRPSAPPSATEISTNGVKSKPVETAEKGVATDNELHEKTIMTAKEDSQISKPSPTPDDEEATSDVLASFIQLFFSMIFGTIWFIFVKLPFRVLTATFVMAAAGIILSYIWLFYIDDNGVLNATTLLLHSNRPELPLDRYM